MLFYFFWLQHVFISTFICITEFFINFNRNFNKVHYLVFVNKKELASLKKVITYKIGDFGHWPVMKFFDFCHLCFEHYNMHGIT